MSMTQRQSFIIICALIIASAILYIVLSAVAGAWDRVGTGILSILVIGLALAAYLRGWAYAPHALVVVFVPVAVFGTFDVETVYRSSLFVPPALALVLLSPPWVIGTALASVLLMGIRVGWSGPYMDGINLVVYGVIIGAMLLARAILSTTARQAEAARQQAEAARQRAEALVESLAEANAAQQAQIEEQRRLLDLVTTLETPAIPLADGVLFAPIVGHLDSRRSLTLRARLLEAAYNGRARHVIVDISGVATVDSTVAKSLIDMTQALKLLGCHVTLSGISSNVALTLTHQGITLGDIATVRSAQEALMLGVRGATGNLQAFV